MACVCKAIVSRIENISKLIERQESTRFYLEARLDKTEKLNKEQKALVKTLNYKHN